MRRIALCVGLVALSACALRPRYSQFITAQTSGAEVLLLLSDKDTGAPLGNTRIELGEAKNRLVVTTKADGTFALPVDKKYLGEDPMLVVAVPAGVLAYEVKPAPAPVVPAESVAPAPVAP
jgi:hypothetical protein